MPQPVRRSPQSSGGVDASMITCEISALGGLGDGIARLPSGEVMLIAGTLPGDQVRVRSLGKRQGVLRGAMDKLLQPSPQRVDPACAAFGVCGGCDLQHWDLQAQRAFKLDRLQRLMGPQGPTATLATMPEPAGHRRRARLHLRRMGAGLQVGMLQGGSDDLATTPDCVALARPLEQLRRALPEALEQAVTIGEIYAVVGKEGVVAALNARPGLDPRAVNAEDLAQQLGLAGLSLQIGRYADNWGLDEVTLDEVDGPLTVRVDAAGFCQASKAANVEIRKHVGQFLDLMGPFAGAQELYAGSGNLTGLLTQRGLQVRAIEMDLGACRRLRRSLQEAGQLSQVEIIQDDVERTLLRPRQDEVWLLDPGRLGARVACEAAARWQPQALVYVSCALDTLGRDLKILKDAGYVPRASVLIDAFGWTVHAEAVVALSRQPVANSAR